MQASPSAESPVGMLTSRALPTPSRIGLVESVAWQILELIDRADLQAGDRLPSTRILAQRFQVATPTIREVLRRLQATGVIDIRHGSGIYVRHGHRRVLVINPHLGGTDSSITVSLLDTRLLIEPPAVALAAQTSDDATVATLHSILMEAERYLVGNDQLLHRANMSFHLAIARSTGNVVLAHIMESLIELYCGEQFAIISLFNARFQDHEEHRAIFDAIRDHDPVRAQDLMVQHLGHVKAVVEARLRERAQVEETV